MTYEAYEVAISFTYRRRGGVVDTVKTFSTDADFSAKTPDDFEAFATALLEVYGASSALKKITVSKIDVKKF